MDEDVRTCMARGALGVDGVGCAVAAGAVLASERVVGSFAASPGSRWPVAVVLGGTSALLIGGALRPHPRNRDLERAVTVNAGWVTACLVRLCFVRRPLGVALLASTAALDGAAAIAQWTLRSEAPDRPR